MGCYPAAGNGPIALILHGLYSHMGWYRELAGGLAGRGVATYLTDRRGAGLSAGVRGHMLSWRHTVDDAVLVARSIRAEHPQRALHAIGISLGGAMSLAAALCEPGVFDRQVLLSVGLAPKLSVPLRTRLNLVHRSLRSPATVFPLPFAAEQLSHDPAWRRALWDDPLRTKEVTARFLTQVFRLQSFVRRRVGRLTTPVLALLAEDDQLVDNRVTIETLRRARRTAVRVELFEGASHVLPACVPAEDLLGRIEAWLSPDPADLPPGYELRRVPRFASGSSPPSFLEPMPREDRFA